MIRRKGVGILMAIILISVFAWVALIAFVIKPSILVGSALSFGGGAVIGGAVAFLLRRWWFKGIEARTRW